MFPQVPPWLKEGESLSLLKTESTSKQRRNNKAYRGFSFRVMRFPVVFEGLGILSSALTSLIQDFNVTKVQIIIKDRHTEEVVNTVIFNKTDLNQKQTGFIFKHFNEKNLPTVDFDGVLHLKLNEDVDFKFPSKHCNTVYDKILGKHGLIHINGLLDSDDTVLPFSKYSCSLVTIKYRVLDVPSLRRHHGARSTQNNVENQRTDELKRLVDREEEDFNDIISLPVLDTTINNSLKMKLFTQHLVNNLNFDHLLLTDDSSFIFTHNILNKLSKLSSSSKLWWSDFQVLKKTGEFVEDKYTSLTYPPVPRSSSMILSRHHVAFIAQNHDFLKQFGSLQTSLGIWLSSLDTKRHQDEDWNMKNCINMTLTESFLACSNMTPDNMKNLWKRIKKQ